MAAPSLSAPLTKPGSRHRTEYRRYYTSYSLAVKALLPFGTGYPSPLNAYMRKNDRRVRSAKKPREIGGHRLTIFELFRRASSSQRLRTFESSRCSDFNEEYRAPVLACSRVSFGNA